MTGRPAPVPYELAAAEIVARMSALGGVPGGGADAPPAGPGDQPAATRPVVLIDGGSGAGKTSLAAEVARLWSRRTTTGAGAGAHAVAGTEGLQVVSLDSVYPGWHGLAAASAQVPRIVGTADPGYHGWDWDGDHPTAWVPLDPTRPIVVEGCGAITPGSVPLATFTVWIELDAETRKARALARDHGGFDPYWDLWAAQEQAHWAANRPWELADLLVDGPATVT